MSKIQLGIAPTSVKLRVKLMNSSVTTGAGLTGLVYNSSGLVISTIQNIRGANGESSATVYSTTGGTIETITTIGTYAAPTATKCRFKEVDATNHPGVYEIQLADARFSATGDATKAMSLIVSISGATNLAQCDIEVECSNQNVNVAQWNGTNVASPATAGIPDVNVKNINNVATTSVTTVSAYQGTTQPVNFTGTGATAYAKVDMIDIAGAAVNTASAQLGVNLVNISGSAVSTSTAQLGVNVVNAGAVAWASGAITDACFASATYPKAIRTATAQAGAAGTITLDASASATNDLYVGCTIKIVSGTGAGQARTIILYTGSSKVAYVDRTWATNPSSDSVFVINVGKLTVDILNVGVATAGAVGQITIASTASAVDDFYDGAIIQIVSGTGAGQSRIIKQYTGASKVAVVADQWATAPDNTSVYVIRGLGDVEVGVNNDKTGYSISGTKTTLDALNDITAASVWAVVTRSLTDKAGFSISGTKQTLDALNDITAASVWSVTTRALTDKAGFSISGTKQTLDALNDLDAETVWGYETRTLTSISGLTADTNLVSISGVTLASGNAVLPLKQLTVTNTEGDAVVFSGTTGNGLKVLSSGTGHAAMYVAASGSGANGVEFWSLTSGNAIQAASTDGNGALFAGGTLGAGVHINGYDGLLLQSNPAGLDLKLYTPSTNLPIEVTGTIDANMVSIDGKLTSGNNASLFLKKLDIQNVNDSAVNIKTTGTYAHAFFVQASATGGGDAVRFEGGNGSHGLAVLGAVGCTIQGIGGPGLVLTTDEGTNGLIIDGFGSYAPVLIRAGETSHGIEVYGGASGGNAIHATAYIGDGIRSIGGTNGSGMYLKKGTGTGHDLTFGTPDCTMPVTTSVTNAVTVGTNNDKTGYALTSDYDPAMTCAQETLLETVDEKIDTVYATEGTILDAVTNIAGDVSSIVAVLPTSGRISNLSLADNIDGGVSMQTVLTGVLSMTSGRFKKDYPSAGQVTFYKRNDVDTAFVMTVTDAERTRL